MSREDLTGEQLESQLRDHFKEEYGDTRRPAELWRAVQPRLERHNTLDLLPPSQRLNGSAASRPTKPGARRPATNEDWLPLPRGVKPSRLHRRPSIIMPAALAACLVLAIGLGAFALSRARLAQPGPQTPIAGVPTPASVALTSPTVPAPVSQGTLIVQMVPSEWLLRGDGRYDYETYPDTSETYSGTASAYLAPKDPDWRGDVYLVKMVNQPELAGKRVRVSAYIKSEGVKSHAELWLTPAEYLPKFGRFDGSLNRQITGTTGWERYEITQDVPPDSMSISFGLRLVGQGKVWIDEARLEVVGPDAPVLTTRSLANPGFESGFDGWDVSGRSDSVKLATSVFHSGGTSMRLEGSKSQPSKLMPPVEVKQTVQLSGWAGKRIRVTAFVKTENVSKWGTIYADLEEKVSNSSSRRVAHDDLYTRPIPSTSDWSQYSIVLDVPEGTIMLTVGAFVDGGGVLLLDDVQIEEVGKEVALTGVPMQDQPTNLDFEAGLSTWLVDGTYPAGYQVGLDDKDVHGGKASAYVKADYNLVGESDSVGLEQWFDTSQFQGQRIRVSAYIRSNNVSRNVNFRVVAQSSGLRSGNTSQLPQGEIFGRRDWQKYELVVDVPKDSLYISVLLSLEGQGEAWFDDLNVEIVNRSVPLTGSSGGMPTAALGSLQYRYELALKHGGCT
jgi:hypothetical protein